MIYLDSNCSNAFLEEDKTRYRVLVKCVVLSFCRLFAASLGCYSLLLLEVIGLIVALLMSGTGRP